MIAKLTGVVESIESQYVIIDTTSGVGYKVFLPARTLSKVIKGSKVSFHIYTHVREDDLSLFGFETTEDERIFQILHGVSGIGPKSALNILGHAEADKLVTAVREQNSLFFSNIPGIGKKTAQKILLELSTKFNAEYQLPKIAFTEDDKLVVEALVTLGFRKPEALEILEKLPPGDTLELKITKALQLLERKS
ncbi:MAG: Holliday junction branch migration protein RuvA [Patescibacteria group bacterium]